MITLRWMLLLVILPATAMPAYAQGIFGLGKKTQKANPAQRVPELIMTLKSDKEDRQRVAAAEELREYDPKAYGEIIPVLVEAALSDTRTSVRMEALTSLSKIRPVNADAGQTLERAANHDENLRVRLHARTTLWKYQLAGYSNRTPGADDQRTKDGKRIRTDEPPLADPKGQVVPSPGSAKEGTVLPVGPALPNQQAIVPLPTVPVVNPPTVVPAPLPPGPPLPKANAPISAQPVNMPRPLPQGPGFSTAVPQTPRTVPSTGPVVIEDEPLPPAAPPPPLPPK
jgi:hypothetical protein